MRICIKLAKTQENELDWQEEELTQLQFEEIQCRWCILLNEAFFHSSAQKYLVVTYKSKLESVCVCVCEREREREEREREMFTNLYIM